MDEEIIRDIFGDIDCNYEVITFQNDRSNVVINCDINSYEQINNFVTCYMKHTNETLKIKLKKNITEKSIFSAHVLYRCHQDARYEGTRMVKPILEKIQRKI